MTYQRVIPRDLFNEAKLLKCLGKVCLLIHDGLAGKLKFHHQGERFNIEQDKSGDLYCFNLIFLLELEPVLFTTNYNSREPWPLTAYYFGELYDVFTDDGEFTSEFKELIQ